MNYNVVLLIFFLFLVTNFSHAAGLPSLENKDAKVTKNTQTNNANAEVEDFLAIEAAYINQDETDKEYSLEQIEAKDLNLSKDEEILWKRNKERDALNVKKLKRINQLMTIDYKTKQDNMQILARNIKNNLHLPKNLSTPDYLEIAFYCAANGDINCLRAALDNNIAVDSRNHDGYSLLMQAVAADQIDTVRLLLLRGANVNMFDNEGSTALHFAALKKYENIMQSLISMGAHTLMHHDKETIKIHSKHRKHGRKHQS